MSEQLGFMPSAPVTSLPLKLSAAVVTGNGSRFREVEPDRFSQLELSISVHLLGGIEIMLATTHKSGEGAAGSTEDNPAAERYELHTNSILLSSMPDVIHLAGRSRGSHHDGAGARSYTLTLTFSDGNATEKFWSTTFDVPRSPLVDSTWHLTVPFTHSLTSAALPPRAP
ncbi:hypothetical protein [Amycolatopsis sp. FDAARGOS 1241]|uniref:hypothetical protein n=1 Tax=Amycolatopsis sp. FDAARGOS 1241 TaxID=2778070 RepID=UPI00194E4251|nr:hypothetical protein [Amycolatopsis sp. FDAARGOS 1241]QRP48598.1 hypothetical protein I6J71_12605 [Amycolatopsis sp. FDAARGOS 1241]